MESTRQRPYAVTKEQNGHYPTSSGLTRYQPVSIGTKNKMNESQSKSCLAIANVSQVLWSSKTVRISQPHESDRQLYPSSFWTILILSVYLSV